MLIIKSANKARVNQISNLHLNVIHILIFTVFVSRVIMRFIDNFV